MKLRRQHLSGMLKSRKVRRAVLLLAGGTLGALCPSLPDPAQPVCEKTSKVIRAAAQIAATLVGLGG